MKKIITICLNPVYDVFLDTDGFALHKENHVKGVYRCIGGKGLNVSRVLHAIGTENTSYVLVGKENGGGISKELDAEGIQHRDFYVDGRVRENFTVRSDGHETRICTNTFSVSPDFLDCVLKEIVKDVTRDTIVVCSGKFPGGISRGQSVGFVKRLSEASDFVALDSNYFSRDELLDISPWLIKPNEEEIMIFSESGHEDPYQLAEKAKSAGLRNILLSLGGKGAYYTGEHGKYTVSVPKMKPVSTIGAGDATLAGFIKGFVEDLDIESSLRLACAAGSAACLEEGTTPPSKSNILQLSEKTKVRKS
ncbi:MAG: 1-phosphofructokinase family hexose kinase [Clostridia bacterium]|nr:1-phosphofructokinase family hexose kinase [Clostridia bacterium]